MLNCVLLISFYDFVLPKLLFPSNSKSCKTQGTFVCSFVRSSPPGPLRPEFCPLRAEIYTLKPEIYPLRPRICLLRPKICSLWPEICPLRPYQALNLPSQIQGLRGPEMADFRLERVDFSPGMDGRTNGRTVKRKSPVFYRTSSPSGPLHCFPSLLFTTMQSTYCP